MRLSIGFSMAIGLLALASGPASAELQGFVTNDVVRGWNSPDRSRSLNARTSRRSAKASSRRVRTASIGTDAYDDGSRPQRRGRVAADNSFGRSRGSLTGVASFYWQPQRVASGGWFNPNALTAAHKTLPFGTRVRVTHLGNGRSVVVRINDRGPYIRGRIIDLSKRAAGVIGMQGSGVARVKVDILGR